MSLFLIAHKVRGEAAFDVAEQVKCEIGVTYEYVEHMAVAESHDPNCSMCDGAGFWWIIPTSGHRAFPYRYWNLEDLFDSSDYPHDRPWTHDTPPDPWPDHYAVNNPEHKMIVKEIEAGSLLSRLGLTQKREPIKRRF